MAVYFFTRNKKDEEVCLCALRENFHPPQIGTSFYHRDYSLEPKIKRGTTKYKVVDVVLSVSANSAISNANYEVMLKLNEEDK